MALHRNRRGAILFRAASATGTISACWPFEREPELERTVMREFFSKAASAVAHAVGMPATFLACCAIVVLWAVTGPLFGFSDTWQLIINTGTTIVTFLMVFLIQNTQNRDGAAIQAKLDELRVHRQNFRMTGRNHPFEGLSRIGSRRTRQKSVLTSGAVGAAFSVLPAHQWSQCA